MISNIMNFVRACVPIGVIRKCILKYTHDDAILEFDSWGLRKPVRIPVSVYLIGDGDWYVCSVERKLREKKRELEEKLAEVEEELSAWVQEDD